MKPQEKEAKGLLKKKISALTLEDFAVLDKLLGTANASFPMWGTQRTKLDESEETELRTVLSGIRSSTAERALHVFSERPLREVLALAYSDMPVPSMLPLFKQGLERRYAPINRQREILQGKVPSTENVWNRTQFFLGDPGHGKSFMASLLGRMRTKNKITVHDCGGGNMNDLLFEMVLDFGAGDALPRAIDKRLMAGSLEGLSIALLKQLDSDIDQDIKEAKAKGANDAQLEEINSRRLVTLDGENIVSVDWDAMRTAGTEKVERAFDILNKVAKVEKLDAAAGNKLGMNSQYGPLIRAYLNDEELVLDEYNKSREGSDNKLQTIIQFLVGEIDECTVDNPLKNKDNTSGPSTFTFRRSEMGAGFFVTFTGNKTEDGITTRSLNRSVYDRLQPDSLPNPNVMDWQHRLCQLMVGLPVSTLYQLFKEKADDHPEKFGKWLLELRREKAKLEGVPVPELQETLLANWQNVVSASEKLAEFYYTWAEMTDEANLASNGNGDLVMEVDSEYSKKDGMSFRRIKTHLDGAIPLLAQMEPATAVAEIDFDGFWDGPEVVEHVDENISLRFGSRLVDLLEETVYAKSAAVGKPMLYAKLKAAMKDLRGITLQEGALSEQKSVEDLLNISAFYDKNMMKQAEVARKTLCAYIRAVSPEITAEDDQIITIKKVHDALKHIAAQEVESSMTLFVPSQDHEAIYAGHPFAEACVIDSILTDIDGGGDESIPTEVNLADLVHHDELLTSFALPTVGVKNLSSIWEDNIRKVQELEAGHVAEADEDGEARQRGDELKTKAPLDIAANVSNLGLATTTLVTRYQDAAGKNDDAVIHVVRNVRKNRTLLVGEALPQGLSAAFNEAGITYVDRNDPQAKSKVNAALADLMQGLPSSTEKILLKAVGFRNSDADALDLLDETGSLKSDVGVSDLLVDRKVVPIHHKVVISKRKVA